MAATNIEHITITEDDAERLISPFKQDMVVWKVGLYYGSLLYFEMGQKHLTRRHTERGEFSLTLECDEWYLQQNNIELCNSVTIDRTFVEGVLHPIMTGAKFAGFAIDILSRMTTISLDSGYTIKLAHENSNVMDRKLLFTLYLPERGSIALKQGIVPTLNLEINHQKDVN
jgi:hypothetical protein